MGFLLYRLFFEIPHGADFVRKDQSVLNEKDGNNGYSATTPGIFREIMKNIMITDQDVFMDVGCGKGYVCYMAQKYEFRKCIGIEYDKHLTGIAEQNKNALKLDKCSFVNADAGEYDGYGEASVLFMFNPFGKALFIRVIDRIIGQIGSSGYKTLIYYNPVYEKELSQYSNIRLKKCLYDKSRDYRVNIYEVMPG